MRGGGRVRRWAALGALAATVLAGCGAALDFDDFDTSHPTPEAGAGADGMAPGDAGAFVHLVSLLPEPLAVRRGAAGTLTVTVDRHGVEGSIDLAVSGLPSGASAAPAQVAAGATTATLTITTTDQAPIGSTAFTVTALVAGATQESTTHTLLVAASRFDPAFGDGGIIIGAPNEVLQDFDMDDAGRALVAVVAPPAGGIPRNRLIIYRDNLAGVFAPALLKHQAGSGYRIAVAPAGGIIVLDSVAQRLESYPDDGGIADFVADLPAFTTPHYVRIRISADGRIMVYGDAKMGDAANDAIVLLSFAGTGEVDTTFGDGGLVIIGNRTEDDVAGDLIVSGSGLVACGTHSPDDSDEDQLALYRFGPSGAFVPSFGDAGAVVVANDTNSLSCLGLVADGARILAAGVVYDDHVVNHALLAGFNGDGTLDDSFGDGGLTTHPALGQSALNAVATDGKGSLYGAGYLGSRTTPKGLVTGDLADGGPDLLFGLGDGGGFPFLGSSPASQGTAVRTVGNGRVLVVGSAQIDGAPTWFVMRLLP